MTTVFPTFRYRDPAAATEFLERAFGFSRHAVHEDGGAVRHAELRHGDGMIMLGAVPEDGPPGPPPGSGATYVAVDDVDALHERARAAGAEILIEPFDTDYGSRDFAARDLDGNVWYFGTYRPQA